MLTGPDRPSIVRPMSNHRTEEAVRLARLFRALSTPSRVELLKLLGDGCCEDGTCCTAEELSLCIQSLAAQLGLVKSTVSHHLKELAEAGLITLAKRGRHNDFSVNRDTLRQAKEFLDGLAGRGVDETTLCCQIEGEEK